MAVYSIKNNRLQTSFLEGMAVYEGRPAVALLPGAERHMYLGVIDSTVAGSSWGRLSFAANLTEDMAIYVYAAASDFETAYDESGEYRIEDLLLSDAVSDGTKKGLLRGMDAARYVGKTDVLLYGITGRYLYVCIDVIGEGEGTLSRLRVDTVGDRFMETLPAIYRERDSFLHRYMSIFSSIYSDFDREIDRLPKLLDADTCPAAILPEYARWLGIDLSGDFLSEEAMRTFVREGYQLNRMKGTKACLARVFEIVLGERVIILEQNTIRAYMEDSDIAETKMEHESIYDVNVLIKKPISDTDRHQLLHLAKQFVPIRTRLHLIQLKDSGVLDTDVYLDMNAVLSERTVGSLDSLMELDDEIIMED